MFGLDINGEKLTEAAVVDRKFWFSHCEGPLTSFLRVARQEHHEVQDARIKTLSTWPSCEVPWADIHDMLQARTLSRHEDAWQGALIR